MDLREGLCEEDLYATRHWSDCPITTGLQGLKENIQGERVVRCMAKRSISKIPKIFSKPIFYFRMFRFPSAQFPADSVYSHVNPLQEFLKATDYQKGFILFL